VSDFAFVLQKRDRDVAFALRLEDIAAGAPLRDCAAVSRESRKLEQRATGVPACAQTKELFVGGKP